MGDNTIKQRSVVLLLETRLRSSAFCAIFAAVRNILSPCFWGRYLSLSSTTEFSLNLVICRSENLPSCLKRRPQRIFTSSKAAPSLTASTTLFFPPFFFSSSEAFLRAATLTLPH